MLIKSSCSWSPLYSGHFLIILLQWFFRIYSYFLKQIFMLKTESDVKIFAQLLNWYSNLHAPTITKMYSTGVKIITSYKAINLPYENNVSSLVSLVILFHSLSLCSWFLPLFILNSTSAWWKMNANWRSWKNTTKNLKSSVVGNFFFSFFSQVESGRILHICSLIDCLIPNRFYRKFSFISRFWKASITRLPRSLYQFPKPSDRNFL